MVNALSNFMYVWEDIMGVSRTKSYYNKTKNDYRYILKCPVCGSWEGKHRMSKKVKTIATSESWYHKCYKNKKSDDWDYKVLVNPDETHMLRLDDMHWSCLKERHKNKIREFAKGEILPDEAEPLNH